MKQFFSKILEKNKSLPLEQQIFNEVLLILSFMAFLTAIQNLFVNLPLWFSIMFFVAAAIALSIFFLNYYTNKFIISRILFLIIIYTVIAVGWLFNGGIDGAPVLFTLAVIIYTIGFYSKRYLLISLLNILAFSSLVLLNYFYPETLLNNYQNETDRVIDVISSYILIVVSIVFVLKTILRSYDNVYKIVEKQKSELELLNAELVKANVDLNYINASKDKLFSIIAHDLRIPFSGILGFSELMLENINNSKREESLYYAKTINKSAENTLVLIENLLTWARSQSGKIVFSPEKLKFSSIIKNTIESLGSSAEIKKISINYYQSTEIELYADHFMLQTILQNLISNAIKFTMPEGKVEILAIQVKNNVEVTVSDNGIGINKETADQLFSLDTNLSTQGTASEKGSGLGLVLCREFVEKHGGKIWVESEPGKGSDFKFILPLYKREN